MASVAHPEITGTIPATMPAGVLSDSGFQVKEVPVPRLPAGGLLIRVSATTICGSDLKTWRGQHVKLAGSTLKTIPLPRIMGHEIAGVVAAVADGVTRYEVGDTVSVACVIPCGCCRPCRRGWLAMCDEVKIFGWDWDGGFAEFMAVPRRAVEVGAVNLVSPKIQPKGAALAEPLSCAINAQKLGMVGPGDSVVVIGAGAVGCLNVELARTRGADQVIIVQRSRRRLEKARMAGAQHYISAEEEDPVERVMEITRGDGADVVMVCASSAEPQRQAIEMTSKRARVCLFAGLGRGTDLQPIDTNLIHYRELRVYGAHGSDPFDHAMAARMIGDERIDTSKYVEATFPLDQLELAIEAAQAGQSFKVAVVP